MAKRWECKAHDSAIIESVIYGASQKGINVSPLIASLLAVRNIVNPEDIELFLKPNIALLRQPKELAGCEETAHELADALAKKEKIFIYGDYDVDGITATVILRNVLKALGGDVHYYIPSRADEGYGLHSDALKTLKESYDAQTVITVDCGINSIEQAKLAKELGIRLLITDHHTPGRELPDAAAITHPQLARNPNGKPLSVALKTETTPKELLYPFPELCGAAVALKVAWATCQAVSGQIRVPENLKTVLIQSVGLAALGTISDCVPLVDENRILVHFGLKVPLQTHAPLGLQALLKFTRHKEGQPIDSELISHQIAPRLNAAGRMGQAQLAVELLHSDNPVRINELAVEIDKRNEDRKKCERDVLRQAMSQIEAKHELTDPAFVLSGSDWHKGVIGIVAGRLADMYGRPVILISEDKMGRQPSSGSARSGSDVHLYNILEASSEFLVRFGGHAAAAGLGIANENINAFRQAFCDHVAENYPAIEGGELLSIDAEFPLCAFNFASIREINGLSPFGEGNRKPIFCSKSVTVKQSSVRSMGKDKDAGHFTCRLVQDGIEITAKAFSQPDWVSELQSLEGTIIDVVFTAAINTFAGNSNAELQIIDWRRG